MGVARELFRVFDHSRVRRGQIRELKIDRLQQTKLGPDDVRHFSRSKESHVAQKMNPLRACEHAVILLAPFKRAEGWSHRSSLLKLCVDEEFDESGNLSWRIKG
jgi:hypothetical protein